MAISRCSCVLLVLSSPVLVLIAGVIVENILNSNSEGKLNSNMSAAELIGKNKVKNAVTGEYATMESFWENQPAVIIFFRRWGCVFCRLAARELTSIKSELDAQNVRLIGIGVEDLGKEDFINGNHFGGELFVDENKKCYQDLGYKRYGKFSLWPALLAPQSLSAIWASKVTQNVGGDTKGDIYQIGGTLVIGAGGKELLNHKQQALADHVNLNDIRKSLGIEPKDGKATENSGNDAAQCTAANANEATPCQ